MNITGNIIKNPLTIIAIFAGIVEIGSNTVLPFLTDENQSTYIWFLMIFPILLVLIFFYILYNKHEVLYAPSDYTDDKVFQDILNNRRKSTSLEINKKLKEELKDLDEQSKKQNKSITTLAKAPQEEPTKKPTSIDESDNNKLNIERFRNTFLKNRNSRFYTIIESYLLNMYKIKSNKEVESDITLEDKNGNRLITDGVIIENDKLNIIEVKVIGHSITTRHLLDRYLERHFEILNNLSINYKIDITFIILSADNIIINRCKRIEHVLNEKYSLFNIAILPNIITSFDEQFIEYIDSEHEKNTIHLT